MWQRLRELDARFWWLGVAAWSLLAAAGAAQLLGAIFDLGLLLRAVLWLVVLIVSVAVLTAQRRFE